MKLLEARIRKDGIVKEGNVLKIDSFLNHQMDVMFFNEMGKEFKRLFEKHDINKILTIEASGIGIAVIVGLHLGVPVVFAKKSQTSNISREVYCSRVHSYTHNVDNNVFVSKQYLNKEDKILIIDDFLANGCALKGLIDIVYIHNEGAAWGMLSGKTWVLVAFTTVAMCFCGYLLWKYGRENSLYYCKRNSR